MNLKEKALYLHKENVGKISLGTKVELENKEDLSLAYTPGVAEPCKLIAQDESLAYDYTSKGNLVAVVSDGSAVLGLGDIGPTAAMPVMEGKALLFKRFGDVDAFPICLDTQDVDEIVETVVRLSPTFGGINLEDISAPRCFEIEQKLKQRLNIPIFHDDQHGTAIVVLAAILNALKVVKKELPQARVTVCGDGAAGTAVTKLLLASGVGDVKVVGLYGILTNNIAQTIGLDSAKVELAGMTNKQQVEGSLRDAMMGADIFIGVSAPGIVDSSMISVMAKDAIVIAMANPVPEIYPDEAIKGGARVVGTGRSDFANQVNNVSAFPGLFRGALDVRATDINEEMKVRAAYAIAALVGDKLSADYILPEVMDTRLATAVAKAVATAAWDTNVAQVKPDFATMEAKLNALWKNK